MTIQETGTIMDILKIAYPQFYAKQDENEQFKAAQLWATMFAGDDVQIVAAAVQAFIASDIKGFPPSIGIIKDRIHRLTMPEELNDMEAWSLVSKAIRNGTYGSVEEYAKLPPEIQQTLGSHNTLREWAMVPSETVETVIQSNFIKAFRQKKTSAREYEMLPENVKALVGQLTEKMAMLALDRGEEDTR